MSEQTAQEPTMEEILASIRRIISEDEAPAAGGDAAASFDSVEAEPAHTAFGASAEDEDVLELSEPYQPEAHAAPEPAMNAFDDHEIVAAPRPAPAPAPAAFHYEEPAPSFSARETLVEDHVAQSVASAFGALRGNPGLPQAGRTLEDLVRELMRPIIKDWLDQNLPGIVRAEVAAELERINRLSPVR
jgi:cell pole-organizing protein PopZ